MLAVFYNHWCLRKGCFSTTAVLLSDVLCLPAPYAIFLRGHTSRCFQIFASWLTVMLLFLIAFLWSWPWPWQSGLPWLRSLFLCSIGCTWRGQPSVGLNLCLSAHSGDICDLLLVDLSSSLLTTVSVCHNATKALRLYAIRLQNARGCTCSSVKHEVVLKDQADFRVSKYMRNMMLVKGVFLNSLLVSELSQKVETSVPWDGQALADWGIEHFYKGGN